MTIVKQDPSRATLENLRTTCGDLGIKWHHRCKASTLMDRIATYRDAQKERGPEQDVMYAMPGEYRAALRVCCRDVPNAGRKVKKYIRELMERVIVAESASSTL
jgi:hypothetical protein